MRPTAQQVWEATIIDPKFISQVPEGSPQRDAIRPFIEGSVEALGDQLENTVTLQTICNAKVRFLRYCVENNIGKLMSEITGMESEVINGMFDKLIDMFESMLKDVNAFLEEHGVTEEQIMTSPEVGMSADNQHKWREGTLTIGELLVTQPSIILTNDS